MWTEMFNKEEKKRKMTIRVIQLNFYELMIICMIHTKIVLGVEDVFSIMCVS